MQDLGQDAATVPLGASRAQKFYYLQGPVSLGEWACRLLNLLILWERRWVERRQLEDLDAHLLKDMGITRRQVSLEARKPFWRA